MYTQIRSHLPNISGNEIALGKPQINEATKTAPALFRSFPPIRFARVKISKSEI